MTKSGSGGTMQKRVAREETREDRITMEIVVDAHGADEQAMGWHAYLEEKLAVPFKAKCVAVRRTSPLKEGDIVQVLAMAESEECLREMFVDIEWNGRTLAVPLMQLATVLTPRASRPLRDTAEALDDWRYWVARGYEFG